MEPTPVYIGTSGWYYDHWVNVLYPDGLPKGKRFDIYAKEFNAVEINATFYRLPSISMVNGWYGKAPDGFIYAVKANRNITHNRKLKKTGEALSVFLQSIIPLKDRLGVVLFQLPPSLKRDIPLLDDFLNLLPDLPKSCFEFRHESWECEETYSLLRSRDVGHVIVSKKNYPFVEEHTGHIAYYRLHGPEQMCASPYSDNWLSALAAALSSLSKKGITSHVYFNNDIGGHAVRNARSLKMFFTGRDK